MRKLLTSATAAVIALSMAAPAFAHSSASVELKSRINDFKTEVKTEARVGKQATATDLACMQAAIEKRENALIAAVDANNAAWKASLTTRRDELIAAWKLTDSKARREAVKAAWKKFRDARKTQRETLRTARKNAWEQFKKDAKACKTDNPETGVEASIDAQN